MFLAGLHEKIPSKVLESGKTMPYDIYKKAVEIETIEEDKKVKVSPVVVTAVSYEDSTPANATENKDLDEEELQAINPIRAQKGKAPYRKSGPNGGTPKTIQCRYCNKFGHMQKVCKARQRDKAPMLEPTASLTRTKPLTVRGLRRTLPCMPWRRMNPRSSATYRT